MSSPIKALKWLLKCFFSKNFLLWFVGLAILLITVVSLTHYFYNKYAERHLAEVTLRWEKESGDKGVDVYFPRVAPDFDFYKDDFFIEYLSRSERPLGRIGQMPLIRGSGSKFYPRGDDNFVEMFPKGEFSTKKEAAFELKKMLIPFESDVVEFERMLSSGMLVGSSYNPPLMMEDFELGKDWRRLALKDVLHFFVGKVKLSIVLTEHEQASRDLKTALKLHSIYANEPILRATSIKWANTLLLQDLLIVGMREHFWTESDLEEFSEAFERIDFQSQMQNVLFGERIHRRQLLALIDEYGERDVFSAMDQELNMPPSDESLFDWSDKDWSDKVRWDLLIAKCISPLIPDGVTDEGGALDLELQLDLILPQLKKPIHINTFDQIAQCSSDYPWYQYTLMNYDHVFQYYYWSLLSIEMQRKLGLIAVQLEKEFLVKGVYPKSLKGIASADTQDIFSNSSVKYELTDDGSFELYSDGANPKGRLSGFFSSTSIKSKRVAFPLRKTH